MRPKIGVFRPMFHNLPVRLVALLGVFLLAAGAVALWVASANGSAEATTSRESPAAPSASADGSVADQAESLLAPPPAAAMKSREEQRFARADKDDDGRITQAEYLQQRRRKFDKLDTNGDGKLAFAEYAASGIDKFNRADGNRDGQLLPAEFATTAPRPKNRQTASVETCSCPANQAATLPAEPAVD